MQESKLWPLFAGKVLYQPSLSGQYFCQSPHYIFSENRQYQWFLHFLFFFSKAEMFLRWATDKTFLGHFNC